MQTLATDRLVIAGVELRSRLFLGTGKYADDETMLAALKASGCELVTVALRRLDLDDPVLAKKLEEIGTVTVMPLGSPIGSAQGLQTLEQIRSSSSRQGSPSSS